jgi:hypothetical protein
MKAARLVLPLLLLAAPALAGTPQDFRQGIELRPLESRPVGELLLPDAVYQGVTRPDLADLDVFNAEGTPVPHAFCTPPQAAPAAPPPAEQTLPVFPLQTAHTASGGGTQVEVVGRDGLTVAIKPSAEPLSATARNGTEVAAYVIDARALSFPLTALRVRWRSPDGASELHVRVEESADLDQWRVLVPQTALLHAGAAGQTLQRELIPLPPGRRGYLRITRQDAGPAPVLDEVLGEMQPPVPAVEDQPVWFGAQGLPPQPDQAQAFDAGRLAPAVIADIALPAPNMDLEVALQSRSDPGAAWRTVWSGPLYSVGSGAEQHNSAPPAFDADSDRYWRIQVLQGAATLGSGELGLKLGYHPLRLRFLEQGSAPYLLAYGSARVPQGPGYACDALLQGLPGAELQGLIGRIDTGGPHPLAGEAALRPPAKPTPTRQILLWAVLLLGAGAVVWMALGLLRNLRS